MNKIRSLIVDDETSGIIVLKELFNMHCPNIEVVGKAQSVKEAYGLINELQPHLVFLDIQMPGENGFELLKKYEKLPFEVIFVTSYDKYAINAIRFSALDYLLKPVDVDDLKKSIEKARERIESIDKNQSLIINLLHNLDDENKEKKIVIHHQDRVKLVNLSDIICFEAESNYTHIYTNKSEKYTPSKVLKEFEEFVEKYDHFIRINKKAIINLNYIKEYSKGEPHIIFLSNGKEYEISRRKKAELNARMK